MITHKYRTLDVPVAGGSMRVGVWDPIEVAEGSAVPSVLAVHGITSSHLVWPLLASELPATRVIAPICAGEDRAARLRGRPGCAPTPLISWPCSTRWASRLCR